MLDVALREMRQDEWAVVAGVLARGMRDNPVSIAMFGPDPALRVRRLLRLFGALLAVAPAQPVVAIRAGIVVGAAAAAPPGRCRPSPAATLRILGALLRSGPRPASRALTVLGDWGAFDPDSPHWHVGPVAVEPGLQGRGVGSRLMQRLSERIDAVEVPAYLETDRPENVGFYQRFGYRVVGESAPLGVRSWFMLRGNGTTSVEHRLRAF